MSSHFPTKKVILAKQLSFKRGKVLEPKPEDSSPRWTKFRKRVVQEQKMITLLNNVIEEAMNKLTKVRKS
ncbi:hypothetical protein AALP_AA1G221500, partial [Arabis alpina]